MRLWHYELLTVLPRQQLLSQWRECCCIAKNIYENGTPNHILVNKINNYPSIDFDLYTIFVYDEMKRRGYKCDMHKYTKYRPHLSDLNPDEVMQANKGYQIFKYWHDERYLKQCFYNLQEKYDCDGISEADWEVIYYSVA